MPGKWLETLKREEDINNTAAALRERQNCLNSGPDEKLVTPINPPSKTSKTPPQNLATPIERTDKTSKTTEAERLGLIATWSAEFGYVSIHDPLTGEWHDLNTKDAPSWAVREAWRRKELYRDGNRKAHRLTSREMEELWQSEHPVEEGIVEEHPVED